MSRWVSVAAALAAGVAACGGVGRLDIATPPDTTAAATTSTTAPADLTGVSEESVPGTTSPGSISIRPGQATLTGTVIGPSGPVGGASVEVDRFVGGQMASLQITAGPDGAWAVPGIEGGRYRVRAWQAPTLTMGVPQIFFLGATEDRQVPLDVTAYNAQSVSTAANPTAAPVGDGIAVAVSVDDQIVGTDGYVTYQPSAGVSVQLTATGSAQVGADPLTTDADGVATFTLSCGSAGGASGTVTTPQGTTEPLPSLSCYDLSSPAPTLSPGTSSTTSTTTPGSPSSSTPSTTTPGLPLP